MKLGICPDFPVFAGDWLASTEIAMMTAAEEGAYFRLLTKEEAVDFLQVTVRGLEKWMAKRQVPFFRIGKKTVRFKLSDLDSHLEQNCRVEARN